METFVFVWFLAFDFSSKVALLALRDDDNTGTDVDDDGDDGDDGGDGHYLYSKELLDPAGTPWQLCLLCMVPVGLAAERREWGGRIWSTIIVIIIKNIIILSPLS